MKKLKKILFWSLIGFIAIQLVPVDRENPTIDKKNDFTTFQNPPEKVKTILKKACYDCHSYETVYPDYTYVAPISWSVKHHINEGRENLNFSTWGKYNDFQKNHILERTIHEIRDQKMPLPAYTIYHEEAKLTEVERKILVDYFEELFNVQN